MNAVKKITIRIAALVMIVISLMLIANNSVFLHVHHLPDGTVVAHAHPYNKSTGPTPEDSHRHSSMELLFLQSLLLLTLLIVPALLLLPAARKLHRIPAIQPFIFAPFVLPGIGRAPPCV